MSFENLCREKKNGRQACLATVICYHFYAFVLGEDRSINMISKKLRSTYHWVLNVAHRVQLFIHDIELLLFVANVNRKSFHLVAVVGFGGVTARSWPGS